MPLPTLIDQLKKSQCTTICIVHSGFSGYFELYHSPVFRCGSESEVSRSSLRHHTRTVSVHAEKTETRYIDR